MAKSRGRKLAELVAPTNGVFAAASIPTIALSKLANSTFSVNSESASLGGNVVLDSNDVTEHSSALYFTNARAQGSLSVAANSGHGALSYDNSNGQFTFAGITTEALQDVVGAMFSSNTETAVTVTYQDSDGTIDLIVDDTTKVPLAGGTMTGNLTLGDNVNAYFGASTDLRIYHDGTNSHIINSTGELRFSGSDFAIKSDSAKLLLGADDDLQIYHDGSHSTISDQGTGHLKLLAGDFRLNNAANNAQMISAVSGGAVYLFHNNAVKLTTTSTGIDVTGSTVTDGLLSTGAITVDHSDGTDNISLTPTSTGGVLNVRNSSATSVIALDGRNSQVTIAGFASMATGAATSKFAVATTGVHASYDFYNNGTTYLNGAVTVDDNLNANSLTVNSAFTFPTSDGSANQILQTNGSGTLSWVTNSGGSSQWTASGSDIYYTSGEVGIGTNNPSAPLHVVGSDSGIKISSATSDRPHLSLVNGTAEMLRLSVNANYGAIGDSTGGQRYMVFRGGNIGIGTDNPSANLDIIGGGSSTAPTLELNSSTSNTYNHAVNAFNANLTAGEGNIIVVGKAGTTKESGWVGYKWNGTGSDNNIVSLGHWGNNWLLNVMGNGNVGLGTESPAAPLHVNSATDQHIILSGATNPYIRWQEGSTDKAFIQWNAAGYLEIKNQEDASGIRIKDALDFSLDGSTYHSVWHAGNDGAGSGLDADTLDGVQAANFVRTDAGSTVGNVNITFSGTPASSNIIRFDNASGQSMNSASSYLSRLECRQATAGADAFMSFHVGGDYAFYFGIDGATNDLSVGGWSMGANKYKVWHAGNDGTGSGLDADLLDGLQSDIYFKSYTNNNGGWSQSNRNFSVRSGGDAVGLHMEESDGTFGFQLYANNGVYGFLDAEWAGWDIQKTANGAFKVDEGSGLVRVLTSPESNIPSTYFNRGTNAYGVFGGASGANLNTFFTGTPRAGFFDGWSGSNFPSGMTHVHGLQVRHNSSNHYGWQLVGQYDNNGDLRVRNVNNGTFSSWYKVWTANTDGSGSGLDADLLDGYQLNTGRANVANRVVATDVNGYIQSGWINTTSGDSGVGTDLTRIYCSHDNYLRYLNTTDFKIKVGLSGQTSYDRKNYTTGTEYMTGANSHNDCTYNELLQRGCGFNDNWNSGAGKPPSGSHFNGFTAMHYASGSSYFHGMQMAMSAGNPGTTYLRGWWANGGSGYAWQKIWTDGNDGSGSGLDADLLDGLNAKSSSGDVGASQVLRTHSNSYTYLGNWIQVGTAGLFSTTTNGAHIYPNAAGTYGTWNILGSRNGYSGIYLDNGGDVTTGMYDSGGNGGDYYSGSWHFYWNRGNACLALGGSTTSSSYKAYVNGALYATANIVAYSDRRIKENIVPIDNALEKVNKLAGVYYNKIDDEKKTREIGFIAQDVNEVTPELVTYAEDIDQYGVKYGNTTALLVEAVKELTQQVKDLKEELKELKNG